MIRRQPRVTSTDTLDTATTLLRSRLSEENHADGERRERKNREPENGRGRSLRAANLTEQEADSSHGNGSGDVHRHTCRRKLPRRRLRHHQHAAKTNEDRKSTRLNSSH